MANIKEYVLGDYLKADEVTKGDMAVIITTPELKDKTYQGKTEKKLEGMIDYKGKQRLLSWNKTNAKACGTSWGEDTQAWVGKVISLDTANQLISGNMKKVLLILPKEELVKPDWVTEEMIQGKIALCSGLIDRSDAVAHVNEFLEKKNDECDGCMDKFRDALEEIERLKQQKKDLLEAKSKELKEKVMNIDKIDVYVVGKIFQQIDEVCLQSSESEEESKYLW